jgi:general secretion pathway protein G
MKATLRTMPALLVALVIAAGAMAQDPAPITQSDRGKINTTRETMRALAQDLRAHMQAGDGDYPAELKGLVPNIRESLPKDAWGNEFAYEVINTGGESDYRLSSLGADGKKGGAGAAADIVFTKAGEVRELSAAEKAEREQRREVAGFQAHLVVARAEMAVLGSLVVTHRRNTKAWPATLKDLRKEARSEQQKAQDRCFVDPWGHDYELRLLPKDNVAIVCWGADGKEGGKDRDADFVITEKDIRSVSRYNEWGAWRWRRGGGAGDWQVYNLADSVKKYKRERGSLPKTLDDLLRGGNKPGQNPVRADIPRDRWGNEFAYVVYGDEEFFLVALGKDGIQGGKGDDADIITPQPGQFERDEDDFPRMKPKVVEEDKDALKAEIALEQVKDIADKLNDYKKEKGTYPDSLNTIKDKFPGEAVPEDPWGNSYVLTLTKNDNGELSGFTVKCLGSDGAQGGKGNAGDLIVNEKGEQVDKPQPADEGAREEAIPEDAPEPEPDEEE